MNSNKGAVICATIAGILGAIIWAWIGYQFHIRIGYIAIGIGALVGLAAAMGAGGEADTNTGIMAAIIAVVAITFGRYAVYHFAVEDWIKEYQQTIDHNTELHDIANDIVTEKMASGSQLTWPTGRSPSDWTDPSELPPKIWGEANARWQGLTADQRTQRIEDLRTAARLELKSDRSGQIPSFFQALSFFDYLYAFVAAAAAFKLGGGFD